MKVERVYIFTPSFALGALLDPLNPSESLEQAKEVGDDGVFVLKHHKYTSHQHVIHRIESHFKSLSEEPFIQRHKEWGWEP